MPATDTKHPVLKRRLTLAAAGILVVPLGLAARFLPGGIVGDAAGGVLYAVLIYLLVAFVAPRWPAFRVAALALGICVAVELLQLTPMPARWGSAFPPLRLVLGSTFVATDLIAYALGAALAALGDGFTRRPRPSAGRE